jgi:hypothetical protein
VHLPHHRDDALAPPPPQIRRAAFDAVTLRWEAPGDQEAIHDLVELSGAAAPSGTLLIGEQRGRIVAALSLETGATLADPFVPNGDVQALLALRAEQVRAYLAVE